jgi:uncharacterized protein
MKTILLVVWLFSKVCFQSIGQTTPEAAPQPSVQAVFPKPVGYVNDFEQILSPAQEKEIADQISRFEKQTGNQIAVVTIDAIAPYPTMQAYATDLSNTWGVGQRGKDNGLLIVVSAKLRQSRISTGLGTEKILTDEICKEIMGTYMLPQFKKGAYFDGLQIGLTELINRWK